MSLIRLSCIILFLGISACGRSALDDAYAGADIGLQQEDGRQVDKFTTPARYKQGDGLITYEGPGWESDKVAFRLYLDGRNAIDLFGKKIPEPALPTIGRGDDYHEMADWGMDILKVGASLGAGGLGVFENGEVRQLGHADQYAAEIIHNTNTAANVRVTHFSSASCQSNVITDYQIAAAQRKTSVDVKSGCALPYAAGLVIHPGTEHIDSQDSGGEWQYIARYGEQSLVPDGLGLAIFYRDSEVMQTGQDVNDDFVVFHPDTEPFYFSAAAWAQEPGGIKDAARFKIWLRDTQRELNQDGN